MIKIVTDTKLEQKQLKQIFSNYGGLCPWYSTKAQFTCPETYCEKCINKNIKWKVREK